MEMDQKPFSKADWDLNLVGGEGDGWEIYLFS